MRILAWSFMVVFRGVWLFLIFLFFRKSNKISSEKKFMSKREAKEIFSFFNKGVLINGFNKRLSCEDSYQNICLIAKPGGGKTTKYIVPNVLDKAKLNCSMVVNDPKGEVHKLTSGYLKSKGFEVLVFNVENASSSNCFNPCFDVYSHTEIEQIAETLVWSGNSKEKDLHWNNGASRIISVLLKCLSFGDPGLYNLPNLYYLLQNFGDKGEDLDQWVLQNCWDPKNPRDQYVLNEWRGAVSGNDDAVNSFVNVALTALKSLSNKELSFLLSKSDYDLSILRKQKVAIFFIVPPQQQRYYSFLTSVFFKCIFNAGMKGYDGRGSIPLYIFYDEFGNSGVPDFSDVVNTSRGYDISISIVLQSISQLSSKYGKDTADSILGAMSTCICYSGADVQTTNYFSSLSGRYKHKRYTSYLRNTYDVNEFDVFSADEIRMMHANEALIIVKNKKPLKIKVLPYYKHYRWNKLTNWNPVEVVRSKINSVRFIKLP